MTFQEQLMWIKPSSTLEKPIFMLLQAGLVGLILEEMVLGTLSPWSFKLCWILSLYSFIVDFLHYKLSKLIYCEFCVLTGNGSECPHIVEVDGCRC